MKYDLDHSTPYFQGIFQNVSDADMTGGVKALQALTTYHKKNHYLLNTGDVGYEPPSWLKQIKFFLRMFQLSQ